MVPGRRSLLTMTVTLLLCLILGRFPGRLVFRGTLRCNGRLWTVGGGQASGSPTVGGRPVWVRRGGGDWSKKESFEMELTWDQRISSQRVSD